MVKIDPVIQNLIEKSIIAFATVDKNNSPNVIAIACCKVVSYDQVLISDNYMNKTRINLKFNQRVSLSFWTPEDNNNNQGYQLKGIAKVFTSGKWKKIVDNDPNNSGLAHKAAILVTVTEIWDLADPKLICQK